MAAAEPPAPVTKTVVTAATEGGGGGSCAFVGQSSSAIPTFHEESPPRYSQCNFNRPPCCEVRLPTSTCRAGRQRGYLQWALSDPLRPLFVPVVGRSHKGPVSAVRWRRRIERSDQGVPCEGRSILGPARASSLSSNLRISTSRKTGHIVLAPTGVVVGGHPTFVLDLGDGLGL